jgi:hypothetical protein
MSDTFILLSRGEVIAASKLIVSLSTFWSDYSHWKYEKRRRLENGGHSLSEAWTGIIGC